MRRFMSINIDASNFLCLERRLMRSVECHPPLDPQTLWPKVLGSCPVGSAES